MEGVDDVCGDMSEERERAELALEKLRATLEDIIKEGGREHPGIDAEIDAARALEGLDRAEDALRKWYERDVDGEWMDRHPRGDDDDEDVLVLDHDKARLVLAWMHIVDALPPRDGERRSVEEIAEECDRDEEYVRDELERLAEWGVADLGWDGPDWRTSGLRWNSW